MNIKTEDSDLEDWTPQITLVQSCKIQSTNLEEEEAINLSLIHI